MTADGKRTARLHDPDAIAYVEQYAKDNHLRIYEAVEQMIQYHKANARIERKAQMPVIFGVPLRDHGSLLWGLANEKMTLEVRWNESANEPFLYGKRRIE